MSGNQARFRVATMARVFGVSPSGYYAWRRRPPSARARADAELRARVQAIHGRSRGTYGAPRIHAELTEGGVAVSRKRVARVMRSVGVAGVSRRRGPRTTRRNAQARPAPDRVARRFEADAPNRLWVADITYVPTLAGFLYLAIVLDVFSRRVVGWAMAGHLRTALVVEALEMAVDQRRPVAVIHHSDQGCQYTSLAFGARCRERGVALSMGSVGDCFDNAMAESLPLECELLDGFVDTYARLGGEKGGGEGVSAMPKTRSPYAAEFRQQMVDLVRSGRAPEDLAREFEPSSQAIRTWVAQAGRDAGERSDGLRTEERDELRRLRRENRRLREEREILAKATAWFAREARPGRSTGS